jgi:predicted lipoprotein with Yx(FWY)xxD motif
LEEHVMQRRLRTVSITAAMVSAAILMSACGNDKKTDDSGAATTSAAGASSSPAAGSSSSAAAGGAVKLMAAKDAKLGDVVTDAAGFTLYRFDKDSDKPPTATCTGDCATNWPPVAVSGKPEVEGVDAAVVGTVKRADGVEQATINGWPVYRFAGDSAPGQTNGQGVGKVWFAVTPAGGKAGADAAPASAPASSPASSYSKKEGY